MVDPDLSQTSKFNVGGLSIFEIPHPTDATIAEYLLDLNTRVRDVRKNRAGQDVTTIHKILYVMYTNDKIPTLWPQFDTYSTAASIFLMINREQRYKLFRQRVRDLPIKFREFPKVRKHKGPDEELISVKMQIKAFTNILSGITRGAVAKEDFSRDMGRKDVAIKSFETNDLESAAKAFFALALDWQQSYMDFRQYLEDLAAQASRAPGTSTSTSTTATTSSQLLAPLSEPRSNTLQRSARTSSIRESADILAHFGTPEAPRGRSRSPPRGRRNTNVNDDDG
jgi:hypothetical protein